jgi:hypothetical protein
MPAEQPFGARVMCMTFKKSSAVITLEYAHVEKSSLILEALVGG